MDHHIKCYLHSLSYIHMHWSRICNAYPAGVNKFKKCIFNRGVGSYFCLGRGGGGEDQMNKIVPTRCKYIPR